jgi:hypothetical protein
VKTYISGPMTGLPEFNFPAFFAAAAKLRAGGLHVVNPAELNTEKDLSWYACMRKDIAALVECDTILMLKGWEASEGAKLEHHIATRLGMAVVFEGEQQA